MTSFRYAPDMVWTFRTARFLVALEIIHLAGYQYDGDDECGETQADLDSGELLAFDSRVTVSLDGVEIGSDSLGGSLYSADTLKEFWTAHRDSDAMNRNCTLMRAARGDNVCICHYFPDMVRSAIAEARKHLASVPHMRTMGRAA